MSLGRDDHEILQGVTASIAVPAKSAPPLDELLEGHSEIEQRLILFFDERLRLLVSLDFPSCTEDKLQLYLKRLELKVEVWLVAAHNGKGKLPADGAVTRDLVASEHVNVTEDPITLVKQGQTDAEVRLQLVWEVQLMLRRPHLRSPDQSIVFLPIATIVNLEDAADDGDFLEQFTAPEPNVLSPLHNLPGVEDPYLPISRLEKVVPVQPRKANKVSLKNHPSAPISVHSAVMPRLRYNKINTSLPYPTTIASLDIEMIPCIDIEGTIHTIDVAMANGKAVSLMQSALPMACKSKDCITFLYDLKPAYHSGTAPQNNHISSSQSASDQKPNLNVDILSISVCVFLHLTSSTIATIVLSWTTNVDFSTALNPAFGAPAQPLSRPNRPTSLNFAPSSTLNKQQDQANSVRPASSSLQTQAIPQTLSNHQPPTSVLSISFTASLEPAHVGVPFSWHVLIINNSSKAVRLAIVPLPRIQRPTNATQHFAKRHAPKASNASLPTELIYASTKTNAGTKTKHSRGTASIAKAVVEEQALYALHHSPALSALPIDTDLVSLTAELRIGPIGVGQCHETEITFLAYKAGVFAVDAVRVVDLAEEVEGGVGVINDIRELPEIVVVENEDGGFQGGSDVN